MRLSSVTHRFFCIFFFMTCFCSFVSAKPGDASSIDLGDGLKMDFVKIDRGSFVQGDARIQAARKEAGLEPQIVQLTQNFILGKYEVTQAQYQKIVGKNPSYFVPGQTTAGAGYTETDNHPVEQVSWYDAIRFCNALSANQGLMPCYTNSENGLEIKNGAKVKVNWEAKGFRLPTVAEWTYCSRAGKTSDFPWGNDETEATIKKHCWYESNADSYNWTDPHAEKSGTQPVGTRLANPWGLHDMFGNVNEWCWDAEPTGPLLPHHRGYKIASDTYKTVRLVDPRGIETDDYCYRAYRGGCYADSDDWLPNTLDDSTCYHPDEPTTLIGFRVLAIR